jgi:hypothetical protein
VAPRTAGRDRAIRRPAVVPAARAMAAATDRGDHRQRHQRAHHGGGMVSRPVVERADTRSRSPAGGFGPVHPPPVHSSLKSTVSIRLRSIVASGAADDDR